MLDALNDAERRRGVIRIVLDPRERHDFVKLGDLSDNVDHMLAGDAEADADDIAHRLARTERPAPTNRLACMVSLARAPHR